MPLPVALREAALPDGATSTATAPKLDAGAVAVKFTVDEPAASPIRTGNPPLLVFKATRLVPLKLVKFPAVPLLEANATRARSPVLEDTESDADEELLLLFVAGVPTLPTPV